MPASASRPSVIDELDARLIAVFSERPTIGVLGASRALGVARGTVQARLDRLQTTGVIRSFAPTVDPASLGYPVTALCTLEIRQRLGHQAVVDHLLAIPEVLEIHST
ncbi:MAG: Lrp/AsnC family transcriptional regulator, partial [Janibacter sp.]|nr:Lrp/AsnC family transcriptional regulator [Janibacter sp.]